MTSVEVTNITLIHLTVVVHCETVAQIRQWRAAIFLIISRKHWSVSLSLGSDSASTYCTN